jgi:Rrf2 family protein
MASPTSTQFAVAVHVLTYLASVSSETPSGGGASPTRSGEAASPTRAVSSDELSRSVNANPVHVRRVLGPLREAGLVSSRPGPHGGWVLGRPAADITAAEVWDLVQGDDPVLGLHGPSPACPVGRSIQHSLVDIDARARRAVRAELDRVTVADLAAGVTV